MYFPEVLENTPFTDYFYTLKLIVICHREKSSTLNSRLTFSKQKKSQVNFSEQWFLANFAKKTLAPFIFTLELYWLSLHSETLEKSHQSYPLSSWKIINTVFKIDLGLSGHFPTQDNMRVDFSDQWFLANCAKNFSTFFYFEIWNSSDYFCTVKLIIKIINTVF